MPICLSVYYNYTDDYSIYELGIGSSSDHLLWITALIDSLNNFNADSLSQRLRSRRAVGIKVWRLTNTDSTVTESLAQSFVIECRGVEGAAIVPDC